MSGDKGDSDDERKSNLEKERERERIQVEPRRRSLRGRPIHRANIGAELSMPFIERHCFLIVSSNYSRLLRHVDADDS